MNRPALIALLVVAPAAFVLIVALIRGYTIHIHFRRNPPKDRG